MAEAEDPNLAALSLSAPVDRALFIRALGSRWRLATQQSKRKDLHCAVCGMKVQRHSLAYDRDPRLSGSKYDRRNPRAERIHPSCVDRLLWRGEPVEAVDARVVRCPA